MTQKRPRPGLTERQRRTEDGEKLLRAAIGESPLAQEMTQRIEEHAGDVLEGLSDEEVKKAMAVFGMEHRRRTASEIVPVTVDNFVEAETAKMFDGMLFLSDGGTPRGP